MQGEEFLKRLRKIVLESHDPAYYSSATLCSELRTQKLPVNLTHKVEYLLKERELLIYIISDYQLEYKVPYSNNSKENETIHEEAAGRKESAKSESAQRFEETQSY